MLSFKIIYLVMQTNQIDYDVHWKEVINAYIEAFLAFFLPDLFKEIDFSEKPIFLDKELHEIIAEKLEGTRISDTLVEVKLKNGEQQCILIHVEVQSYHDTSFPLRMYTINYRLWDKHNKNIAAIAVFTTSSKMKQFYERKCFGTKIRYDYINYYIKDQAGKEVELKASDNIFATIVLASLYAQQTKEKDEAKKRLFFKKQLIKLLFEKQFTKIDIKSIILFIDAILKLPSNLQIEFKDHINEMTKMKTQSPYQTESTKILVEGLNEAFYGTTFEKMIQEKDEALEKIIQEKDGVIQEKDEALQEKDEVIQEKDEALQEKDEVIQEQKEALQKKEADTLKTKVEFITYLHQHNQIKDIEELATLLKIDKNVIEAIIKDINIEP